MTLADILKMIFNRGRGKMLQIGDTAPGFEVLDHTGQSRKLSDYLGLTVVLWIYPKADTPA